MGAATPVKMKIRATAQYVVFDFFELGGWDILIPPDFLDAGPEAGGNLYLFQDHPGWMARRLPVPPSAGIRYFLSYAAGRTAIVVLSPAPGVEG